MLKNPIMKYEVLKIALIWFLIVISADIDACTTFIISGKYTPDGRSVLYKNRDTDEMQNALVFFSGGKYKFIGLVDGNEDWNKNVWGGYNEKGFAIINSAAYNNNLGDTTKLQDQEGVLMKLALENCSTLEDFEQLLNTLPKPLGVDANFGVIDALGGAAFYETGNYKFIKFDANDQAVTPNGIIVRTNHSMSYDITKGYGFCRYNTASMALSRAYADKNFTPQYLINNISRSLKHSLTGTDLENNIPEKRTDISYRFFIDYIPRNITASAVMIVGAESKDKASETMMWTLLGFPLTTVAVPVWLTNTEKLPACVAMSDSLKAPICEAALRFKEDCFPLTYDRGTNYLNIAAVINKENNGYLQVIQEVEKEIFRKTSELIQSMKGKALRPEIINEFYDWLDQYLVKAYRENFNYSL